MEGSYGSFTGNVLNSSVVLRVSLVQLKVFISASFIVLHEDDL